MDNKICKCGRQLIFLPTYSQGRKSDWVCTNPNCPENKPDDYAETEPIKRRSRNENCE